ncbi:MAG: DNA repair protein RadC [bacterium]|nr:DNA repair protein RadC [bacterium]
MKDANQHFTIFKPIIKWEVENSILLENENQVFEKLLKSRFDPIQESLFVIGLDAVNRRLFIEEISKGRMESVEPDPRIIFHRLISFPSAQCIFAHNHPAGDTYPSKGDIAITNRLIECGLLLGIKVLDHIIFNNHRFFSFNSAGIMWDKTPMQLTRQIKLIEILKKNRGMIID